MSASTESGTNGSVAPLLRGSVRHPKHAIRFQRKNTQRALLDLARRRCGGRSRTEAHETSRKAPSQTTNINPSTQRNPKAVNHGAPEHETRTDAGGEATIRWNGADRRGAALPSGVYFAVLKSGGRILAKSKLVLAR